MDRSLLKKIMFEKGITIGLLARYANVVPVFLWLKMAGWMEFTLQEIAIISKVLDLPENVVCQIFFGKKVS